MNPVTSEKASLIACSLRDDSDVPEAICFDPMTILMVISIILSAIRAIQSCGGSNSYAKSTIDTDSTMSRLQLRKIIRHKSKDLTASERKDFRKQVEQAVRKVGKALTMDELQKLMDEASAAPASMTEIPI